MPPIFSLPERNRRVSNREDEEIAEGEEVIKEGEEGVEGKEEKKQEEKKGMGKEEEDEDEADSKGGLINKKTD